MCSGNTTRKILLIGLCSLFLGIFFFSSVSADSLDITGNVAPSDQYKQTILDNSTVTASPLSQHIGSSIVITVSLRDYRGPLSGHTIVINGVGLTALSIIQNSNVTDANGLLTATIQSANPGAFTISAVDTTYQQTFHVDILLSSTAQINFLPVSTPLLQVTPTTTPSPTPTISITAVPSPTPLPTLVFVTPTPAPGGLGAAILGLQQMFTYDVCSNDNAVNTIFYILPFILFPLLWKLAANKVEAKEASLLYAIIVLVHMGLLRTLCMPVTLAYTITLLATGITLRVLHQPIKALFSQPPQAPPTSQPQI